MTDTPLAFDDAGQLIQTTGFQYPDDEPAKEAKPAPAPVSAEFIREMFIFLETPNAKAYFGDTLPIRMAVFRMKLGFEHVTAADLALRYKVSKAAITKHVAHFEKVFLRKSRR